MTQAGGPAAINGFLYQILHHLGWLANVSLSGLLDGTKVQDAVLVLEPRQGGDARAESSGVFLVEQYKTRNDGTWSVADIVSVLGDLRKSVPPSHPTCARYRFVTDGRPGLLDSFTAFLNSVRSVAELDDLDRTEKRRFNQDLVLTDREFFDHVVSATHPASPPPARDAQATVLHLLTHFQMEFNINGDSLAIAVQNLLRRYAPDLGDERDIQQRLIGVLVETLSKGEARLDVPKIDAMLRNVGLNTERMHRLAQLAETLAIRTTLRLTRLGYRPLHDIRPPPNWPKSKKVLLIAGTSGAGKTWQLGQLLRVLGRSREITTFVLTSGTREEVLADAARDIWQTGLGETSEKSLVAISQFLRELISDADGRQVTIAADAIQDVDLARALVRQDWAEWEMRLVLTVPSTVAHALEATDRNTIHVHYVDDFSPDELDLLLRQGGRSWAHLPPDLKQLLRRPILAGLFLKLPYHSVQGAPQSEYEIFEEFWARIIAQGHPGDEGIVTALAASFMDGNRYPLPRQRWQDIGLSDDSLTRLDAAGWINSDEDGAIAFAHDRLLNWAVAKKLVRQYAHRQLTTENIASLLSNTSGNEGASNWQRLGYVVMDVFWLLAESKRGSEKLASIAARLEDSRAFGSYGEDLYATLLPTLGQRAVPILLARLDAIISEGKGDYRVGLIGRAFANLAQQEHVELSEAISSLLQTGSQDRHNVAIAALIAAPDATYLDRLWDIHQRSVDALRDKADVMPHVAYEESFNALLAGVAQTPEWLRRRIHSANRDTEHVSELGYLLLNLEHPDAPAIWKDAGDALMAKVPASKPRSLLYCIARFGDHGRLSYVNQNLTTREDFGSSAALYALSVLDPRAAIERLVDVGETERSLSRNQWLPGLLRAEPALARQHVLAMAKLEPKGRRTIEILFSQRPNELDENLLQFVIRSLEADLREYFAVAGEGDLTWLIQPLKFLGQIIRPDLLAILEAEAGGDFERMITEAASSRLQSNSNWRDHVREEARKVLILIGGGGITTLLKKELESEHYWVRYGGLGWAFMRKDDAILEKLSDIARRPLPRNSHGRLESEAYSEYHKATCALAALGADSDLVNVLLDTGEPEIPVDLAELRARRSPLPKVLTERAAATIANQAATENELLVALGVISIGGDVDFIPAVRAVLAKADPSSVTGRFACIALQELGDLTEEFARLSYRLAQTSENVWWGLNALASLGDHGAKLLNEWLRDPSIAFRVKYEGAVIRMLYEHSTTRVHSVEAAVASCHRGRRLDDAPYDIAAESDDRVLREQILDKAFAARSFVVTEPLRAIEGLAKFDVSRAVSAIELALHSHPKIERQLCRLLVRIAPETAARRLIQTGISLARDSLNSAIGRALRRLDPESISPLIIESMKGAISERRFAAQLAAWLPLSPLAEALGDLADRDSVSEVRHAALLALEHHRQEANLRALFEAFRAASCNQRWSLLTAILDSADPYLLTDRDDALWLGNILTRDMPAALEWHAKKVLHQRKQKHR